MSRDKGEPTEQQSWHDPGQNRESGGTSAEQTPYAGEADTSE